MAQGFAMVHYRIYTVTQSAKTAISPDPKEVECADDREVVALAMQMKNGLDMEIWETVCHPADSWRCAGREAAVQIASRASA